MTEMTQLTPEKEAKVEVHSSKIFQKRVGISVKMDELDDRFCALLRETRKNDEGEDDADQGDREHGDDHAHGRRDSALAA